MTDFKVELLNIQKSFGGISALQDVTLRARAGEIHALVGENGAGKSTLMKILAGAYQMDRGEILINQKKIQIGNPGEGRKNGVGIIYQEFSLVQDLSVAENIYLHFLNRNKVWMPWSEIHSMAGKLIGSLGFEIPTSTKIRDLKTSEQQVVEIAKALSEDVDILILDEPTAVLAPRETQKLFEVLAKLKEKRVTIIYISHRLEEIFEIADNITILKDGRVVKTSGISELNQDEVIISMIGRKLDTLFPKRENTVGRDLLKVRNLKSGKRVQDVSFTVKEGEVLGIGGLIGCGRTETLRAIFSADKKDSGEILLDGNEIKIRSPREAVSAGIGMVPEDRKTQGILLDLSIRKNLTLTDLDAVSGGSGLIRERLEKDISKKLINNLRIRAKNTETRANQLSGGNQQKVVLAKWLGRNCKVILMDEPTRGIDIGAKADNYQLINDLAKKGIGIVLGSSEMMELIGMCDRILVMHEGRISGELGRSEFSEENIMRLSLSKKEQYEN